jgi:hypothetical protein
VVGEDRGRERELASLVSGEGVDEDEEVAAAEEEVAAGGGEQSRRVRRELAVGEWPREDERGEGDELAGGAGAEEERGQAGTEEAGGGGAEQAAPGAAGGGKGVEGAEAGEEAPHHLRERQIGQAAPVADRHLAQDGGERGQFFGGGLVWCGRFADRRQRGRSMSATSAARTVCSSGKASVMGCNRRDGPVWAVAPLAFFTPSPGVEHFLRIESSLGEPGILGRRCSQQKQR